MAAPHVAGAAAILRGLGLSRRSRRSTGCCRRRRTSAAAGTTRPTAPDVWTSPRRSRGSARSPAAATASLQPIDASDRDATGDAPTVDGDVGDRRRAHRRAVRRRRIRAPACVAGRARSPTRVSRRPGDRQRRRATDVTAAGPGARLRLAALAAPRIRRAGSRSSADGARRAPDGARDPGPRCCRSVSAASEEQPEQPRGDRDDERPRQADGDDHRDQASEGAWADLARGRPAWPRLRRDGLRRAPAVPLASELAVTSSGADRRWRTCDAGSPSVFGHPRREELGHVARVTISEAASNATNSQPAERMSLVRRSGPRVPGRDRKPASGPDGIVIVAASAIIVMAVFCLKITSYFAIRPGPGPRRDAAHRDHGSQDEAGHGTAAAHDRLVAADQGRARRCASWFDPNYEIAPAVGGRPGRRDRRGRAASDDQQMDESQEHAAAAALAFLGYDVKITPVGARVLDLAPDGPAAKVLRRGRRHRRAPTGAGPTRPRSCAPSLDAAQGR